MTDTSSSGTEMEEQSNDHSQERKLLQSTKDHQRLLCNLELVKKLVITVYLLVVYFLCTLAFSTISPFFPKEVRY